MPSNQPRVRIINQKTQEVCNPAPSPSWPAKPVKTGLREKHFKSNAAEDHKKGD